MILEGDTRVIYVDVDDTLVRTTGTKVIPVPKTVAYIKAQAAKGAILYLWSRGGAVYAKSIAEKLGVAHLFVAFLPKPDVLVDDALETAFEHCEWVHPLNADDEG